MPAAIRYSGLAAAFGLIAVLSIACGGVSNFVPQPTPLPQDPGIVAANDAWNQWKLGPGQYLDQDFLNCYELNDIPIPDATPLPDPSGHSRARRFCSEAIQAVIDATPDYERFATTASQLTRPQPENLQAQFDAVLRARFERLQWAKDLAVAYKNNDTATLQTLRQQIPALANLELLAVGIDVSKLPTPAARPTLPYIPGIPTPTPAKR
jgi:hypothetical protein